MSSFFSKFYSAFKLVGCSIALFVFSNHKGKHRNYHIFVLSHHSCTIDTLSPFSKTQGLLLGTMRYFPSKIYFKGNEEQTLTFVLTNNSWVSEYVLSPARVVKRVRQTWQSLRELIYLARAHREFSRMPQLSYRL